jgi:hypothetical protein
MNLALKSTESIKFLDSDLDPKYFGYAEDGVTEASTNTYVLRVSATEIRKSRGVWNDRATLTYV